MTNFDRIVGGMEDESRMESDFYKIVEGDNKMRIISDFMEVKTKQDGSKFGDICNGMSQQERERWISAGGKDAKGKPVRYIATKGWAWAVIRSTGTVKVIKLAPTILRQLAELKSDPEWAFDSFPMPYDINVKAKGAGSKEVEYSIVASKNTTPVTEEEMAQLNKKKTIPDLVASIAAKQAGKSASTERAEYPSNDISPDEMGF